MFITVAFYLNRSYELCIIRNTNYGTVLYARALKTVPRDSLVNSFLFLKNGRNKNDNVLDLRWSR